MAETKNYTIGRSRINKALLQGFRHTDSDRIHLDEGQAHILFFTKFNSMEKDSTWGRLHTELALEGRFAYIIRAFASNNRQGPEGLSWDDFLTDEQISAEEKKKFMERAGCKTVMNQWDIILYELIGQYLWISIEVIGSATGYIDHLRVFNPGDNFMQTFPDIYQETGSFFHRYMSVYSTLYNSLGDAIAHRDKWLDLQTAPPELLSIYAQWLGLDVRGEFLNLPILRRLLQETYRLNRMKGTREALSSVIRIVMGEEAIIVERNLLDSYIVKDESKLYNTLYGDGEQDVTVLIPCRAEGKLQVQLEFLLKQFKPMRSRLKLVCYTDCIRMDSYCYLDHNARLYQMPEGSLDSGKGLNASSLQN